MKKKWLLAIRVMEARPRKVTEATPSAHQAAGKTISFKRKLLSKKSDFLPLIEVFYDLDFSLNRRQNQIPCCLISFSKYFPRCLMCRWCCVRHFPRSGLHHSYCRQPFSKITFLNFFKSIYSLSTLTPKAVPCRTPMSSHTKITTYRIDPNIQFSQFATVA